MPETIAGGEVVVASAEGLPFEDGAFDAALSDFTDELKRLGRLGGIRRRHERARGHRE